MRMVFVVVLEPLRDEFEICFGIWQRVDVNIIPFEGFDEGFRTEGPRSDMPLLCGLLTGVKQDLRLSCRAKMMVSLAV